MKCAVAVLVFTLLLLIFGVSVVSASWQDSIPPAPPDPMTWLGQQIFVKPDCDSNTYEGFVVADSGASGEYEVVQISLQIGESYFVHGDVITVTQLGVVKDMFDEGNLVMLKGPISATVEIRWGAYYEGLDEWGFWERYDQKVLKCLYPWHPWSVAQVVAVPKERIRVFLPKSYR
ncbi:MAG: hypothetical protein ABIB98_02480 [bacterium]